MEDCFIVMDLGSNSSGFESVEDNGFTREWNNPVDCSKIQTHGSCLNEVENLVSVRNVDADKVPGGSEEESGLESAQPASFGSLESAGKTPSRIKGYGLKKWRRIRRDCVKDISAITENELASPAELDSENSEDQNGKSSLLVGHESNINEIKNLGGKSRGNSSSQIVQQGRSWVGNSKKPRGERIKIEKENSHSSMESDSRSSNFVFMQGTSSIAYSGNNSRRMMNYDEESSDEAQGKEQSDCTKETSGEAADLSQEDSISAAIKGNGSPSTHHDQLTESIVGFIAVQELLGREVQMFSKIGKETSSLLYDPDKRCSLLPTVLFSDPRDGEPYLSHKLDAEHTGNGELVAELESLFQQKIEAEIECLTLTSSIENLKVPFGDQAKLFEEKAALPEKQSRMLNELEKRGEDFLGAEESTHIRSKACKSASCFFIQLGLLLLAVRMFVSLWWPDSEMVVPT